MRKTVVLFAVAVVVCGGLAVAGKIQVGGNGVPLTEGIAVHAMGPITPNSGWQPFGWTGAGNVAITENPITFTLTRDGVLTVVDAYLDGDQFAVSDNAVFLANTSVPVNDGTSITNPDVALANPKFSSGRFPLAAGAHSITLTTVLNPYSGGTGYLRVDSPVPIPATSYWGLGILAMLLAAGGVFVALRMRAH